MAREPHDIFMREFFEHPGWEEVFVELERLALDWRTMLFEGTSADFPLLKGRALGVYDAISHLKGLINKYKG